VLRRIVVAFLEDVVERSSRRAMGHAFIQGPKKAFDLSLEPRSFARGVMHLDTVKQAYLFQAVTMKLGTVIQHEFPHDTMSGPVRPDIGISLFQPGLGAEGILQTKGNGQKAWWDEAHGHTQNATCVVVFTGREPRPPQGQEGLIVNGEEVQISVIDFRSLQRFVGHTVPFDRAEASQRSIMTVTGRVPVECRNLFHQPLHQSSCRRRQGHTSWTHSVFFPDFDDGLIQHVL